MPRKKIRVELKVEVTERDFVMARLAAAAVSARGAADALDEALAIFVNPDEDDKLKERKELLATALEGLGCATRAAESAEEIIDQVDPEEREPWDDEDEEDDDGDAE